jgi:hypothetical protein
MKIKYLKFTSRLPFIFALWLFFMGCPFLACAQIDPYQETNIALTEKDRLVFKSAFEVLQFGGYLEIDGRFFFRTPFIKIDLSGSQSTPFYDRRAI